VDAPDTVARVRAMPLQWRHVNRSRQMEFLNYCQRKCPACPGRAATNVMNGIVTVLSKNLGWRHKDIYFIFSPPLAVIFECHTKVSTIVINVRRIRKRLAVPSFATGDDKRCHYAWRQDGNIVPTEQ